MFPYSAVSASVVSSSSPAAPSSVQVTVQSVSVPARRSRLALHSSSTAMKVATTSERLQQLYRAGAEKASAIAGRTLRKVYKKVGFLER